MGEGGLKLGSFRCDAPSSYRARHGAGWVRAGRYKGVISEVSRDGTRFEVQFEDGDVAIDVPRSQFVIRKPDTDKGKCRGVGRVGGVW